MQIKPALKYRISDDKNKLLSELFLVASKKNSIELLL
jgi:hypothetical protein